jgi:hypothetical protein
MKKPNVLHLSDFPEKAPQSANPAEDAARDWEPAQDRVLLYLKGLSVGPDQRLSLAMQAYERAFRQAKSDRTAVRAAMVALRQILVERNIVPDADIDFNARNWRKWIERYRGYSLGNAGLREGLPVSALAMPPIQRRSMPAAALQFAGGRRVPPRSKSKPKADTSIIELV